MMHHLLTVLGVVIALVLLLVVVVEPVSAVSPVVERVNQPPDISWIFLVLVGGVALLASIVWLRKLRRIAS
jgi:Co/Zn/Cd efflux system component